MKHVLNTIVVMMLICAVPAMAGGRAWAHEGHEHHAQHGGALVGLEYDGAEVAHLELVLDADAGALTAYVLDAEAEKAVRLPQESMEVTVRLPEQDPLEISLAAKENVLTGETVGDTSEFTAQSDRLKGAERFDASVASIFVLGYEVADTNFSYPEGTH